MLQSVEAALLIVDVQRYYLEPASPFCAYTEHCWPGSMAYIRHRVEKTVFPAISRLREPFMALGWPVIFLRLCSSTPDRSDLHRFFRSFWSSAKVAGFDDTYPLSSDAWADVAPQIAPSGCDIVFDKTTYSGFSSPGLERELRGRGIGTVVMAGLATSQCVDTTARDASERGFTVVHVEDAQADYSSDEHEASLFASRGTCGGHVVDSEFLAAAPARLIRAYAASEEQ